jgi:hypothetical protein
VTTGNKSSETAKVSREQYSNRLFIAVEFVGRQEFAGATEV